MKDKIEDYLKRAEDDLGEWKEEFGTKFPIFLNHFLVARLLRAEDEIAYLRTVFQQLNDKIKK